MNCVAATIATAAAIAAPEYHHPRDERPNEIAGLPSPEGIETAGLAPVEVERADWAAVASSNRSASFALHEAGSVAGGSDCTIADTLRSSSRLACAAGSRSNHSCTAHNSAAESSPSMSGAQQFVVGLESSVGHENV